MALGDILVQEGKSPLEENFVMHASILHISVAFPSAEASDFVRVCLDISNVSLSSHPKLPRSHAFTSGLAERKVFPSSDDDLVFDREKILDKTFNVKYAKFQVSMDIEWTVQFHPDTQPQRALFLPKNNLDISVALANFSAPVSGQPKVCIFDFF